jgi:peptidoglycan hydrolase CwlO-like protein
MRIYIEDAKACISELEERNKALEAENEKLKELNKFISSEYKKLKKLDENVKKLIAEQKQFESLWVDILESLYDAGN